MRKRKTERGSGRSSGYFPKLKKKPEKRARILKQKNNKNNKKKIYKKQNETKQGNTENAGCFQVTLGLVF